MATHIIWAVVWAAIMVVTFYGGIIIGGITAFGSAFGLLNALVDGRSIKRGFGVTLIGVLIFLVGFAFAVFSLIKAILQIIAAFHS